MRPQLWYLTCPVLDSGMDWGDLTKQLQSQVGRNCKASSTGAWHVGNPIFGFLGQADCQITEDQKCQVVCSSGRTIFTFKA